jgi:hypothetical protein
MGIFFSLFRRRAHGSFDAIVLSPTKSRKESAESGEFDYLSVDRSFSQVGDPPDMGPEQLALCQEPDYARCRVN